MDNQIKQKKPVSQAKSIIDEKKLTDELAKAKGETEDFKNKYLRALADYQNLEKRVNEEKQLIINQANYGLILRLLPFLDDLGKAQIFIENKDLGLIKEKFYKILKEIGLEEIEILGQEFDPSYAEAVDIVAGEKNNQVVEVLLRGYKLNGKILRIAKVKVSRKS